MSRIALTKDMPIPERLKVIQDRIDKAQEALKRSQVKSTIDVLRGAGLEAKFDSFCNRFGRLK